MEIAVYIRVSRVDFRFLIFKKNNTINHFCGNFFSTMACCMDPCVYNTTIIWQIDSYHLSTRLKQLYERRSYFASLYNRFNILHLFSVLYVSKFVSQSRVFADSRLNSHISLAEVSHYIKCVECFLYCSAGSINMHALTV